MPEGSVVLISSHQFMLLHIFVFNEIIRSPGKGEYE